MVNGETEKPSTSAHYYLTIPSQLGGLGKKEDFLGPVHKHFPSGPNLLDNHSVLLFLFLKLSIPGRHILTLQNRQQSDLISSCLYIPPMDMLI